MQDNDTAANLPKRCPQTPALRHGGGASAATGANFASVAGFMLVLAGCGLARVKDPDGPAGPEPPVVVDEKGTPVLDRWTALEESGLAAAFLGAAGAAFTVAKSVNRYRVARKGKK